MAEFLDFFGCGACTRYWYQWVKALAEIKNTIFVYSKYCDATTQVQSFFKFQTIAYKLCDKKNTPHLIFFLR